VLAIRQRQFKDRLVEQIQAADDSYDEVLAELGEMGYSMEQVANALIGILRAEEAAESLTDISDIRIERDQRRPRRERGWRDGRKERGRKRRRGRQEAGMVRLMMSVGKTNGIRPGDVVYKIASTAQIPGHVIGHIDIQQDKTFVDVPEEHVEAVLKSGRRVTIRGRPAHLKLA